MTWTDLELQPREILMILCTTIKSSRKLTIISNERKFFVEPDALKNKSSGPNVKLKY